MADNWAKAGIPFIEECKKSGLRGQREKFKQEVRKYEPTGTKKAWAENPTRNRFKDIQCLDETRVKLKGDCDYIHASWVTAGEQRYILTQGPLPTTAEHFWNMVIDNKCSIIVMLCQFKECGVKKCFEYFSETVGSEVKFGSIKVKTVSSDRIIHKRAGKSIFEVTNGQGEPLKITHYRFDSWQDHCAPDDTKTALRLVFEVVTQGDLTPGPIVAHCSAGVGRTGSFVGVFMAMEALRAGSPLDLTGIVKKLRDQRIHAVQSDLQYLFLARAVLEALAEKKVFNAGEEWFKTFVSEYNAYTTKKKKKIEEILAKNQVEHSNQFDEGWIAEN